MFRYLLYTLLSSSIVNANIDSGGGRSSIGTLQNHGSIGAITSSGTSSLGYRLSHPWLIEVLYAVPSTDALDSDNDNMPDAWEEDNGLTVGIDDSALDGEKDGASNLMEYLAGTDPNDSNSVLRPALAVVGDVSTIAIDSVLGRNYRLWVSANLGDWEVWDTLAGTGGTLDFSFDRTSPAALSLFGVSELPKCFFRVEVILAP